MPRTLLTAASSAGAAALLLFAVSACGGSGTSSSTTPTSGAQQQNQSARPGLGSASGQGFPGASGKVAAISGKTLQVQSEQTGQVAVTYTATTTFTEAVKASATAVKVGSCVTVRPTTDQATTAAAAGPVTAASVQLSDPVKGECGVRGGFAAGGGFGGGAGGGGVGQNGGGGTRPSGAPTGAPGSGRAGGGFGGVRPVSGLVTAVSGSTITVAAVTFGGGRQAGAAAGTASPAATPTTTSVEVTTTAATTYTKTVSAAAKDLAVGQCVTAIGSANDTGAVTATMIASQPAIDGECASGFGARRTGTGSGGTS